MEEGALDCAICGSVMVDPRVLVCQHAFCLKCLYQIVKRDRSCGVAIKCPFGCTDQTELPDSKDIRSLPKNHLISGMCATLRKKSFEAGEMELCDWCGDKCKDLEMCQKCSAVGCPVCMKTEGMDHEFLCSVPEASKVATDRQFPFLTFAQDVKSAVMRELEEHGRPDIIENITIRSVQVPFFESKCKVTGSHGRTPFTAECTTLTVGSAGSGEAKDQESLLRRKAFSKVEENLSLTPPMSDVGLATLHEVRGIMLASEKAMNAISGIAATLRRRVKIAPSVSDTCTVRHLVTVMRQLVVVDRHLLRPVAQRVALCGNIETCNLIDRLQRTMQSSDGLNRSKIGRTVLMHQNISTKMNATLAEIDETVAALHVSVETAIEELATDVSGLLLTTAASSKPLPPKSEPTSSCETVESSSASEVAEQPKKGGKHSKQLKSLVDAETAFRKLHCVSIGLLRNLKHMCSRVRELGAKVSPSMEESFRQELVSNEEQNASAMRSLINTMGSLQHLHVLWSQMVAECGEQFESCASSASPDTDEMHFTSMPDLVSSLTPQIQSIREQHLQILRRNPESSSQHRALNSQVMSLQAQTFELQQKEHMIQLNSVADVTTSRLMGAASRLFAAYEIRSDGETESDAPPLPPIDGSSGDAVAVHIQRVGSKLNSSSRAQHTNPRIRRVVDLESPLASVMLGWLTADEQASAGGSSSSLVRDPVGAALFIYPPPKEKHQELEGRFLDDAKTRTTALAKACLKNDDKSATGVNVVSTLRPGRSLVPFFMGNYRVVGDKSSYAFTFEGQHGSVEVELPPLRGMARVQDIAYRAVFSSTAFVTLNTALVVGLAVADRLGYTKTRRV